jgi:hypothetical protein
MSMQTIINQMKILYVSFSILQQSQNLIFQCFLKDKNNFLKEKLVVHFPKRTLTIPMRDGKSNHNEQANNNPINSFNESKNKEQTNESSQCK